MFKWIRCLFNGHIYKHVIGTQYMCNHCGKVIWERDYKKYITKRQK